MNLFIDDHRLVLEKLIEKGVDFILIGGYAVNYHGYNRTTADMDVWIKPDNENKLLLAEALSTLNFREEDIAIIRTWDFEKPQKFTVFPEPFYAEFMTHISGIKYPEAKSLVIQAEIDGITLPIIHLNSLLQNKKATGRKKDLADVEYLERIMEIRNKRMR